MIVVHGFARLSERVASPSPFCLKLETWLHLAGIPFEARDDFNPMTAPKGKVPWVTMPDGRALSDSSHIIEQLTREYDVRLDDHLDADARARALLVQRTIEDHLYFCILHDRWVRDAGFAILRGAYFGHMPWPLRWLLPLVARRKVIRANRMQGTSLHSDAEVWAAGVADIDALAAALGDAPYFGGDTPASIDASAFGCFANLAWGPFPGPLHDATLAHPNLVAWLERVYARTVKA